MKYFSRNKYHLLVNAIGITVAFTMNFPELIALFSPEEANTVYPGLDWTQVGSEVLFTYLSIIILFWLNRIIFRFNGESIELSTKKVFIMFFLDLLLNGIMGKCFVLLHRTYGIPAIEASVHVYTHPLRDFLLAGIITLSCYLMNRSLKSRKVMMEMQQLKIENIANQFEALKNQLNPHMLFNSLNTLYSLIRESPEKAQEYLNELSKVMRYTLQKDSDSHSISVKEEMEFVYSYIYLLKMRYEDNLTFKFEIAESEMSKKLPKMSIQLLIENAVKHNEISNRHPLSIEVRTNNDSIEVSNRLQLRRGTVSSTGIGLSNLSNRYKLLYKKDIEIIETDDTFTVVLPLI